MADKKSCSCNTCHADTCRCGEGTETRMAKNNGCCCGDACGCVICNCPPACGCNG